MRKLEMDELNRVDIEGFKQQEKNRIAIVLDNVRSMHNVGSAFRTADAFNVEKVVLCGITAQPPHREIHKTALGATESVKWEYEEETNLALQRLKQEGFEVVGVEQVTETVKLNDFTPDSDKKYAFVFGNEAFGMSEEALGYCDFFVEIPQFGTKHSLNVSVTVGVVLWDYISKTNA